MEVKLEDIKSFEDLKKIVGDEHPVVKEFQTAFAQKEHFKTKKEEVETVFQEYKIKNPEKLVVPPVGETPKTPPDDNIDAVLQLRSEGFSDKEILELRDYSRKMKLPLAEVAKDPLIKAGMAARKAEQEVASATPASSNRSTTVVGGKAYGDMTPEEQKANYTKVLEQHQGRKGNE